MPVFQWLESTALAIWVGESLWGYPIMLGTHAVGLAIVVGIFVMLDLRMLGVIRGISFHAFLSLFRLAWIGFLFNAISGSALFTSQASTFVESTPFLIKISAVLAGVILGVIIQQRVRLRVADWDSDDANIESSATFLAIASLICWIGAIIAGRLIAYL
ncbi:MAG: hypothetical protein R3192_11885 [Woeseiaceae bacterium]|nr:hypothetical protein [Woeseiaceae bacterium]